MKYEALEHTEAAMNDLYKKAAEFLKETLNNCEQIDSKEKKYRYEHSMRIANIANYIAEQEEQDVTVTTVAAILHDVGKFDTDINADHGRVSADVAMAFLAKSGLTDKQISDIHYSIATHVDGNAGYDYDSIPEAETVSDADNIDRFGVYRIYQILQYDKAETVPALDLAHMYQEKNIKRKDFKEKYRLSTVTANRLFQRNLQIQADFFDNLVNELNSTDFLQQ